MISQGDGDDEFDMASVSSASANNYSSFNKMIQDFKKALSERKTPRNLVYLNRLILIILFLTIALACVEFSFQRAFLTQTLKDETYTLTSQERAIQSIQLASNIRSFVNIANNLEGNLYEGDHLEKINRFNYLNRLIQQQASQLKETHDYITQVRKEKEESNTQ